MEVTPRTLSRRRILPSEIIGLNAVVKILLWELYNSIPLSDTLYLCYVNITNLTNLFLLKILRNLIEQLS